MPDVSYFSATVQDNDDPDQLGRLVLVIPGLTGADNPHPDWIEPRIAGGAGPDAAAVFFLPPVDAIVVVEADAGGRLRWSGGTVGAVNTIPPAFLTNYPRRAGMTSPTGSTVLILDDDDGVTLVGAKISLVASEDDPREPLLLSTTFLGELNTWATGMTSFLAACAADAAMSPGVAAGASSFTATHAAFAALVSSATPFQSAVSETA